MTKQQLEFLLSEEGIRLLRGLSGDGFEEKEIAKILGIKEGDLRRLKKNHLEVYKALSNRADVLDYAVEEALYKKAIEGSVTAQVFWLKGRRRDKWLGLGTGNSKNSVDSANQVLDQESFNSFSDDELRRIIGEIEDE